MFLWIALLSMLNLGPPTSCLHWERERVLLIGDSLAKGLHPSIQTRVTRLGASYLYLGEGGTNTYQWSNYKSKQGARLAEALESFKPTLVLISLGTNDEAVRKPTLPAPYGPNFSVAKQRRPHLLTLQRVLARTRSIWLGPPLPDRNYYPEDRDFRDLLRQFWGQDYFDTEAVSPQKNRDRVHVTRSGNEVWASHIVTWLTCPTQALPVSVPH